MSKTIRCNNCGNIFNDNESFQNHCPCSENSVLGGAGDLHKIKEGSEGAGTDGDL